MSLTNGVLTPKAEFPWDSGLQIRDSSDSRRLRHHAFSAATMRAHLADSGYDPTIGYDIRTLEMPSMLSAQGTELGTVGFEYFLQNPVGDAVQDGHEELDTFAQDDGKDYYDTLRTNPEELGLRSYNRIKVSDRLMTLSRLYWESRDSSLRTSDFKQPSIIEFFRSLFDDIIAAPGNNGIDADPDSLKTQIEGLVSVLRLGRLWYDFSQVNWRIRLGQILWSEDHFNRQGEVRDDISDYDALLLQLTLACELLLRLEYLASMDSKTVKEEIDLTIDNIDGFRSLETAKTRWDLVLARRFLDNMEVKAAPNQTGPIALLPRQVPRQLSGLLYFAKSINWPNFDNFETTIIERLRSKEDLLSVPSPIPSVYVTPLSSPRSNSGSVRSSYFGSRPQASRNISQLSVQLFASTKIPPNLPPSLVTAASLGGWLSHSWLSGLVMPGEAISHFLISTLLENDNETIARLGDSAILHGGFTLQGRSWWSKYCIVGKVLAPLPGSSECMGWISVPIAPDGFQEQWIDIVSELPKAHSGTPRIAVDGAVQRNSDILGDSQIDAIISSAELTLPKDPDARPALKLSLESLRLAEHKSFNADRGSDFRVHAAALQFSIFSSRTAERTFREQRLTHNVDFVSAFPCTPPPSSKLQLLQHCDYGTKEASLPGHPLYRSFKYRTVAAPHILLDSYIDDPIIPQITILDARAEPTLEVVARAWCASNGEHAVISRVGTSCIACSVREARGLSIRIVIRVG